MKVHVEHRWQQHALAIWITEQRPGGKPAVLRVLSSDGEGDFTVRYDEHDPETYDAELKPTLVLPVPVVEALVAALADHLPPSAAQGEHLKDAVRVRDRLLTLIEEKA